MFHVDFSQKTTAPAVVPPNKKTSIMTDPYDLHSGNLITNWRVITASHKIAIQRLTRNYGYNERDMGRGWTRVIEKVCLGAEEAS